MGLKNSVLSLLECGTTSSKHKATSCWQSKFNPPSYNHNWTELHYAASHGDVKRITEIMQKTGLGTVNNKDYYGKTALYWASYKGHRACIEALLHYGADVNISCRHGGTPLHTVVGLYPDCAILLIQHGADVNRADNWGVTPMYLAAINAQLDVIVYLILAGATLTYKNKKTGDIPKQLLSEPEFCNYLSLVERSPLSLQSLCRIAIHRHLASHQLTKVDALALPRAVKDFITFRDVR